MSRAGRYFSRKRGLAEFISAGPLSAVLDELAAALEATDTAAPPPGATSDARDT